jgi:hypothetical protein
MFLIELELDPKYLKGGLDIAVLVSHVSIIVPFSLGLVTSLLLYPLVFNNGVSFTAFALFLGAAMSITAFPVLARIITENNLHLGEVLRSSAKTESDDAGADLHERGVRCDRDGADWDSLYFWGVFGWGGDARKSAVDE